MILCLDSGNTRLKWGLRADAQWLAQGVVAHGDAAQLPLPQAPTRILACNVAGARGRAPIEALAHSLGLPVVWVAARQQQCGVTSLYEPPEQLGADRWAALIGARAMHAGPCVVVMCGTATTIDLLDAAGVFQGGLILPGLDLMREALADSTADLPPGRGGFRDLPRNTFDAIASGAVQATLGAIKRMSQRGPAPGDSGNRRPHLPGGFGIRRPTSADFLCLLSGGAAATLAAHLELPHRTVENLVLEGVARIAAEI